MDMLPGDIVCIDDGKWKGSLGYFCSYESEDECLVLVMGDLKCRVKIETIRYSENLNAKVNPERHKERNTC